MNNLKTYNEKAIDARINQLKNIKSINEYNKEVVNIRLEQIKIDGNLTVGFNADTKYNYEVTNWSDGGGASFKKVFQTLNELLKTNQDCKVYAFGPEKKNGGVSYLIGFEKPNYRRLIKCTYCFKKFAKHECVSKC